MVKEKNVYLGKEFLGICFINFVLNLGQFMANTLLPKYANSLGATATVVGVVSSIFSTTSLIMKPFSGPAVDAFKKKNILFAGFLILIAAFTGYASVNSVEMLIVFRLIHGFAMGITVVTCLSMMSDILPEEKLSAGIAYYSMIQALATAVGPGLGLNLAERIGYRATFLTGLSLIFVACILLIFLRVEEKGKKQKFCVSFHSSVAKEAIRPALIMMCLAAAYISISSFLVLHAEAKGVEGIDIYFTVYAIALLISRPMVGKLSERYGGTRILPFTISLFAMGLLMIGLADSLPVFLAAAITIAFGYGACQPLIQAMCIQSVPPERRGSASATSYYGTDLGYLTAPIISGQLADRFGYNTMFYVMALFPLIGLALLAIFRKKIVRYDSAAC